MKINTLRTLFLLFFVSFILHIGVKSQENSNKDQLPKELRKIKPKNNQESLVVVTIDDYDNFFLGTDYAETHVSGNPANPLQYFGAWNASGTSGAAGYKTSNSYDWTSSNPNWGGTGWGDIVIAYDSLGHLYYENMYGSGSVQGCKVAVSNDNGTTWATPVNAISGGDKNWITADQTSGPNANFVYTTMTGNTANQGVFCRSTDYGQTWTQTATFTTQSLPGMMSAVGPEGDVQGGAVYVVTHSGSNTASTYTFYKSTNGGLTFTQKSAQNFTNVVGTFVNTRHSVQNMRTRPYPFLAADNSYGPYRGRLYIVYTSNFPTGSGNKPDIFCRHSDDGGSTFSAAVTVNDDANTINNNNFFPAIWCDKSTGRLYIQWLDTRDTPTADSAYVYASFSNDGGQTFVPNQAISNKKMKLNCTACPGSGTPKYQGDYNGIVSHKNGALLSWTDFRNGTFANYVGFFPDFGMRVSPAIDTLVSNFAHYDVSIPSVKLYTDTVFLTASVPSSPGLFNFSFPNGNKLWNYPGSIPVDITGIGSVPPGSYTVEFTATGSLGTPVHKRTALLKVFNFVPPNANFTSNITLACAGGSVNFTDVSTGPPSTWAWTFQGGIPSTSILQNPTNIVYANPGTYDVKLVITNPAGSDSLVSSSLITIVVQGAAPTTANQTICQGQTIPALTATGQNIRWYSNTSLTNLVAQTNSYVPAMSFPGFYSYYATQTPTGGCESPAATATLTINPAPFSDLGPNKEVCVYKSIILDATASNVSTYQWSVPGVTSPTMIADTSYFGQGAHTIYVTVTGTNGCVKTDSIVITFVPCTGLEEINNNVSAVIYPNPANEILKIRLSSQTPESLNLSIVNILGEVVGSQEMININGSLEKSIDLHNFSEGVYLLRFENATTSATRQFVIKR